MQRLQRRSNKSACKTRSRPGAGLRLRCHLPGRPLSSIPLSKLRFNYDGSRLENDLTMSDYEFDKAAADAPGQLEVTDVLLEVLGGMYHATSGRQDNEDLTARPLTHSEVTVVVPGRGELQLTMPVDVSGADLLQLVQQQSGPGAGSN